MWIKKFPQKYSKAAVPAKDKTKNYLIIATIANLATLR